MASWAVPRLGAGEGSLRGGRRRVGDGRRRARADGRRRRRARRGRRRRRRRAVLPVGTGSRARRRRRDRLAVRRGRAGLDCPRAALDSAYPSSSTCAPPPLVLPVPPLWLEVPGWLPPPSAPKPMKPKPCWIFPRAKTPPTTRTTAPATARAGRSQFITGPCELRRPSSRPRPGPLDATQAVMPLRTGRSDLRRLPRSSVSGVAHARSGASGPAAESATSEPGLPDLTMLRKDSHRTTTSQPSTMNSLRSSHHCRLSHGSLSRARIFVKPSPTGSS